MHVRSKAQRHSIAGGGSKIICREKQEPRSALLCGSASLLRQAERLQRWPIDSRSNREAIVGLERRQRSACLRSEECIN